MYTADHFMLYTYLVAYHPSVNTIVNLTAMRNHHLNYRTSHFTPLPSPEH